MTEQNPNPEPQPQNNNDGEILDKFNEIKERYETELSDKDKEIEELKKQLKAKESEVDDTIQNLNDEVNEKLEQAEKMKELQANINELMHDKAEAMVDKYIQKGVLAPVQRDKAVDLAFKDPDTFIELYENAPSIVDTTKKPKSHKVMSNVDKMVDYFKK